MERQIRMLCASIEADAAFELLDQHKNEFAGTEWMPANLFQRKRIVFIMRRMDKLYESMDKVPLDGLPGSAIMIKARYKMWLSLTLAKRWQIKDQMRFLGYVTDALQESRGILERLRRLAITGQITRTTPVRPSELVPEENLMD